MDQQQHCQDSFWLAAVQNVKPTSHKTTEPKFPLLGNLRQGLLSQH